MDETNTTKTETAKTITDVVAITRRALKLCALALSSEMVGSTAEALSAGYQAGRYIWMAGADVETWMRTYPECRKLYTERDPADPDQHLGLAFDRLVHGWHDMDRAASASTATPAN